jgi:formylglycine-generating enzyme required for sulfatase activity
LFPVEENGCKLFVSGTLSADFLGMKLRHLWLVLLTVLLGISAYAADDAATNTVTEPVPSKNGTNVDEPAVPGPTFTNSVNMKLVQVPGGFWAGVYEVTQKEYTAIMGVNGSAFPGDSQPVENVCWNDAVEFCDKLTARDLKKKFLPKGFQYGLPTEDEWQSLVGDATLDNAVTSLGAVNRTQPSDVGSLAPNNLGLYDIRGNVMEFCMSDVSQPFRFLKGGSWQDFVDVNLRPEFRWYCKPDERQGTFGFRVILKGP